MSTLTIKCPHCGAVLLADDEWRGRDFQCPSCNGKFRSDNLGALVDNQTAEKKAPAVNTHFSTSGPNGQQSHTHPRCCQKCGAKIELNMRFCSQCGAISAAPQRICPNCKSPIVAGMHFCHQCGLLIEEKYEKTLMDNVGTTVKVATDKIGNWFDKLKSNFS